MKRPEDYSKEEYFALAAEIWQHNRLYFQENAPFYPIKPLMLFFSVLLILKKSILTGYFLVLPPKK